ncbi:hypothetical protein PNOK_0740000 [Pyrrhoderma noxium]|uniref:Uncharacterized protein n=1 Tax=Pyrrhoderma noxium TaxID=2282107 RepID=A0A286UCN2_9AGAM|nr:hypothetical protein PNOK_0740000 [Pyrrhoderma noxium]
MRFPITTIYTVSRSAFGRTKLKCLETLIRKSLQLQLERLNHPECATEEIHELFDNIGETRLSGTGSCVSSSVLLFHTFFVITILPFFDYSSFLL